MKLKITLTLLFAFFIGRAILLSQNQSCCNSSTSKVIELDFKAKKFNTDIKSLKLSKGEFYNVEIKNINMNLYNVSLSKTDSIISFNNEFPTLSLIGLESISTLLENITAFTKSTISESTESDKSKKLNNFLSYTDTKDSLFVLNKLDRIQEEVVNTVNQLENESKKINNFLTSLNSLQFQYYVLQYDYEKTMLFDSLQLKYEDASKKVIEFNKSLNEIEKNLKVAKSDLEILLTMNAYKDFINNNFDIKKQYNSIKSIVEKSIEETSKAKDKIKEEKINEIYLKLIHLENNSLRSYKSMPLQFNGDIAEITINITPKKDEFNLQSYSTVIKFPTNKFYAGIGGGFYRANFKNENYSTIENKTSDTTSTFNLVDEQPANFEIGFVSLIHVGTKIFTNKTNNLLGIHFSLGPGISFISKPQVRAAVGGGLSVGKSKNMLSINALAMVGPVNVLSRAYNLETQYEVQPENMTVSKLKVGCAFSLGYIYKF